MGFFKDIVAGVSGIRVVPDVPVGHSVQLGASESAAERQDTTPDDLSALSFFLRYDGGTLTDERRVTLRRIDARGSTLVAFLAHCHERRAMRSFRADRVAQAIDMATGEVLDCKQFHDFIMSRSGGLIERRLLTMARLLVFLGRCDGRIVAAEWDVVERSLVRLQRSLLDDDRGADLLIEEAHRLAPDSRDFLKGLYSLRKTRLPARTHAELRRAVGDVIHADGVLHATEMGWALETAAAIDHMPVCS